MGDIHRVRVLHLSLMLFPRACTDIGTEENLVELDSSIFCKKECDLTNDPARGCVKVKPSKEYPEPSLRWGCISREYPRWQAVRPSMAAELTISDRSWRTEPLILPPRTELGDLPSTHARQSLGNCSPEHITPDQ